jgi:hypothetical protein
MRHVSIKFYILKITLKRLPENQQDLTDLLTSPQKSCFTLYILTELVSSDNFVAVYLGLIKHQCHQKHQLHIPTSTHISAHVIL